ncbi:MAG: hypothetical protein NT018_06045 [Armatimonadetes bacterium]|nr:hypothetical protein [Armatimonadota bacterium]
MKITAAKRILLSPINLGVNADTRHFYCQTIPGFDHLRPKPTQLNQFAMEHINNDHPDRQDWLAENLETICTAVASPEILYAKLDYKSNMKHWTQCHAIEHPANSSEYLIVILSLAALDNEESEFHQVVTVFPAKRRKFFDGEGNLRPKWRLYKK